MTPPAPSPLSYRPDVDGLRAVAVLAVLLHHAWPARFAGGFIGVDIFFVISGYLISGIVLGQLAHGRFSFRDFYVRRIRRIFPALALVLAAVLVFGAWWLTPADYAALGRHVAAGALFVANLAYWREAGYFDAASAAKPLLHLWSLAIEEQFYLLWPLVLWALWRGARGAGAARTGWCIVGLGLLSWGFNLWLVRTDMAAAYFHPFGRFWELMVGAWLAARQVARPARAATAWRQHALAATGVALLVLAFVQIHPERRFPGGWAVLPTLGTALLIAAGPHAFVNRWLLAWRPMVAIGLVSYPLYLWHWPLLVGARLRYGDAAGAAVLAGALLLSGLLAVLTWRWVERPIRRGGEGGRWRTPVTAALLGGMAALAAAGLWVQQQRGFEARFPPVVRAMTAQGGSAVVTRGWRYHDCILDFRVPPSDYKPFCIEERRPLLFIWGDSHASSLYPGFKALQDSGAWRFGIAERAGAVCPPILGADPRPGCRALNDDNLRAIRAARPDIVLLYAWWHHARYQLDGLEATVQALRAAGVPRIVLLGPTPDWQQPLPQVLLDAWKRGPFSQPPPLRLPLGQDGPVRAVTEQLRQRAAAMGIDFIDGLAVFCDPQGCLTRVGDAAKEPLSYDYGHLSLEAVQVFVARIAPQVFGPSGQPRQ